jgi:uncharacterized protein (DUF486 family)
MNLDKIVVNLALFITFSCHFLQTRIRYHRIENFKLLCRLNKIPFSLLHQVVFVIY